MSLTVCENQLNNYTNQLLENLRKRKVHSPFRDNIWAADLADMQLISKFNEFANKYAWVILLKDKKDITITNAF